MLVKMRFMNDAMAGQPPSPLPYRTLHGAPVPEAAPPTILASGGLSSARMRLPANFGRG